jgi:large subunit ribosomal protein L15
LIRKMPKRGFTSARAVRYQVVNLERLEKLKVASITPEVMYVNGLVESRNKPVKILGDGEIKTALMVSAHAFSKTAQEKITAAGGKAEVVNA